MHGVNLFPDFTLFFQLGIFLLCFFVLKTLVFKPYLELLEKRREKTQGLMDKAKKSAEEAEALKEKYEGFMSEERTKVSAWVDGERRKLAEEERTVLSAAQQKAKAQLEESRAKLNAETEKARAELQPMAAEFASEISKKILGEGKAVSSDSFSVPQNKQEPMKAMSRG